MQEKAGEAGHVGGERRRGRSWCWRKQKRRVTLEVKEDEACHGIEEHRKQLCLQ
jgi:hypothetical protein